MLRAHTNTTTHPTLQTKIVPRTPMSAPRGVACITCKWGCRTSATTTPQQRGILPILPHSQEGQVTKVHPQPQAPNKYILSKHFHLVTLQDVIPLLQQSDFMTTLDLKDAYFHIPIHPVHQRFLWFVLSGQHYQFKVPLFGVTTAPRVFTKCLAMVAAHLRRRRIHFFPYLDSWLNQERHAAAMSSSHSGYHTSAPQSWLHYQCDQIPPLASPCATILGALLYSCGGKTHPSPARVEAFQALQSLFQPDHQITVRKVMCLLGMMSSCIAIIPHTKLHMHLLQQCVGEQGWPCLDRVPKETITTDASLIGWGVLL